MAMQLVVPLFPLGTVLFQKSFLPLHIFEPRYVRMIETAIESETGFGVVLIREGTEVHQEGQELAPSIFETGTLASINSHSRLPDGRYQLLAEGGPKFRVLSTWQQEDRLLMGEISLIPDESKRELREIDVPLQELLRHAESRFQLDFPDMDYEDASDVSYRLAQCLGLDPLMCQSLLQLENPHLRLDALRVWLETQRGVNE